MSVVKKKKVVDEYLFDDIPDVCDPFRVLIDTENNRITIHHYDGTTSACWGNIGSRDFRAFLLGLSDEHIEKRFAYERSAVKTGFHFDESMERVRKAVQDKLGDELDDELGEIDDTDCQVCFINRIIEVEEGRVFIEPWVDIPSVYKTSPFIRHIMKCVWPAITKELKEELEREQGEINV